MSSVTPSGLSADRRQRIKSAALWIACCAAIAIWLASVSLSQGADTVARSASAEPRCAIIEVYYRAEDPAGEYAAGLVKEYALRRGGVSVRTYDLRTAAGRQRSEAILQHFGGAVLPGGMAYGCNRLVPFGRDAQTLRAELDAMLTVDLYVRAGCPHCHAAQLYLSDLESRFRGFRVRIYDVGVDAAAQQQVQQLQVRYQQRAASLPVIHFCNQLHVGFDTAERTGTRLEAELMRWAAPCPATARPETPPPGGSAPEPQREEPPSSEPPRRGSGWRPSQRASGPIRTGLQFATWRRPANDDEGQAQEVDDLRPNDVQHDEIPDFLPLPTPPAQATELPLPAGTSQSAPQDEIDLPLFGRLSASRLGLPLFTIAVGLVDGFNPCAMWVLLILLSVLVSLRDRRKILAVAGTFVIVSGAVYYAFMTAWLNVLALVGMLRPVQIALALIALVIGTIHIKDFFALGKGPSLSIPQSAKPGIYARMRKIVMSDTLIGALVGAGVLAAFVNVVELLCTAGLPAMYLQVLTLRQFPAWLDHLYIFLYILAYMFDDGLMVSIAVVTLGRQKLQEQHGRWLKLISGLVVLGLAAVLLLRPEWLG